MFADNFQHNIFAGGVSYVWVRGVGAVRRARQRERGGTRRAVCAGRLGCRAHRGLAGRAHRRRPGLGFTSGRSLRSAGAKRRGRGRGGVVGRGAPAAAALGAARLAGARRAPRLRARRLAHAGARRHPARAGVLRCCRRSRLAAVGVGGGGRGRRASSRRARRARPLGVGASRLLPRAGLVLRERGRGGVRGGEARARGVGRRRRGAVGGGLRRARFCGAGARSARAAGGRRCATGRARAGAAADAGAVPACAPRAALQSIGARVPPAPPAHPRVPRLTPSREPSDDIYPLSAHIIFARDRFLCHLGGWWFDDWVQYDIASWQVCVELVENCLEADG